MTILDAIKLNNVPYDTNCLVTVKIPEKKQVLDKRMHREYHIETTKGRISILLTQSPFFKDLVRSYYAFEGMKVGWLSKDVVTFGPVDMSFIDTPASRDSKNYSKWDIFLSFGGYDPANTHLCFSKRDHAGVHGSPEALNGVVGRVIQGGHLIPLLRRTDSILTFTPLTESRKRVLRLRPAELKEELLTPKMEIYTYLSITLYEEAKNTIDHFLATIPSGKFRVDAASSMYLKNDEYRGAKISSENPTFRQNGAITVRNQGNNIGSIFIYKNDTSFSPSHNVIGRIHPDHLPLIQNANPGDQILVETFPKSFQFIGKTQQYVTEYLETYGITHKRVGDESDDAIIIEQRPQNTIDVWLEKTCVTLGLGSSKIIRVRLFREEAPLSVDHFQKNSQMLYYTIGKLQVLENLKMLMLFLPVTGIDSIEAIPRENIPDSVTAGAIGVTNALRRLTGTIGIRLIENDTYGPTGETLEGTNIIGQLLSNLDFLKTLDTGDMVWFMEVRDDE